MVLDLTILLSSASLVDLTNQRDADAATNATLLSRVCDMSVAKVESVLGTVGGYDDTDLTVGDQPALELGIRLAMHYLRSTFTLTGTNPEEWAALLSELEILATRRRRENSTPVLSKPDNTPLNTRHPHSTWPDDGDIE